MFELEKKIVLAHAWFFNKNSKKKYKENSKTLCEITAGKDYIDIIELDLRKSKDGKLYCFHGNILAYCFILKLPLNYVTINNLYNTDLLEEILAVIPENKSIFLDIKDTSIGKEDLINVFKSKKYQEVILWNKSVKYLDEFENMPHFFTKIMNLNICLNFYNLKKLKQNNYKYIEVLFPFQLNKNIVNEARELDLEVRLSGLCMKQDTYEKIISKFDIKHISTDFID